MQTENITTEVWKDIPGYGGLYQVSNIGRVKRTGLVVIDSLKRKQGHKERILKQDFASKKYLAVKLSIKNENKTARVHRLVALAFVENPKNLKTVDHVDFDRKNNRANNLEWVSQVENNKRYHSAFPRNGQGSPSSKLTDGDVRHIRFEAAKGVAQNKIAKGYGVSNGVICNIVLRKRWHHIK